MVQEKSTPKISFRKATLADVDLVFSWSNDALVREQSFQSEPIVYEDHVKWFANKMNSENDLFLIVFVDSIPAGLVRFEDIAEKTVIGILVDKNFRGKGLSATVLQGATDRYFTEYTSPIFAFIKQSNLPSIAIFKKVGFTFLRADKIEGHISFVYVLKKINDG